MLFYLVVLVLIDPIQQFTSLWGEGGCESLVIQKVWALDPQFCLPQTHTRMQLVEVGISAHPVHLLCVGEGCRSYLALRVLTEYLQTGLTANIPQDAVPGGGLRAFNPHLVVHHPVAERSL